MASVTFLRRVIDLSTCDSIDALLDGAAALLSQELHVSGFIEVWTCNGVKRRRGDPIDELTAHRAWIGFRHTIGAVYLAALPAEPADVELLAHQLAPLAERLLELETVRNRSIREHVEHVYERHIREALLRLDWNASAVARELAVSRDRVTRVARRCRRRSP